MVRYYLPAAVLLYACASLDAQAPLPPFTAKDLELGKKIVATSAEVRPQIADPSAPAEPFKVIGNLYNVGDANGGAYLLTSPEGHILLGTGYVNASEGIQKNIESLGFKMSDIKVILLNHSHPDVSGGAAYFKEKTGAQIMTGFAEIPFLEHRNAPPAAPNVGGRGQEKKEGPNLGARGGGGRPVPSVKVDRALYDGDVVKVGPLSITTYLAPGHSPSSASWLFNVKDGGHTYRVLEFCCWEFPDDISRSPYINEASVRHTFETWGKILPIDIYLENGLYGWGGIVNQPSGTIAERIAKLKADSKLNVDRDIFRAYAAVREVEFQEKMAKLKASAPANGSKN
jgi:glyoxylase-like metal-dependent hydrolase (beta-lactamase superfamily II)